MKGGPFGSRLCLFAELPRRSIKKFSQYAESIATPHGRSRFRQGSSGSSRKRIAWRSSSLGRKQLNQSCDIMRIRMPYVFAQAIGRDDTGGTIAPIVTANDRPIDLKRVLKSRRSAPSAACCPERGVEDSRNQVGPKPGIHGI